MPPNLRASAVSASKVLHDAAAVFDDYQAVQKIDWTKLFELIMKLLPLILTFFKPQEEQPKTE